jgi:hypothetical protein
VQAQGLTWALLFGTMSKTRFVIPSAILELRKFKYAAFASEETFCYEAEVVVNGIPAFHASNDGHGGCDNYTPLTYDDKGHAACRDGEKALEEYGKTLPPDERHGMSLPWTVEALVTHAVADLLDLRDVAKRMKSLQSRVLSLKNGALYQTKKIPAHLMSLQFLQNHAAGNPGSKVINLMPREEQEAIFLKLVRGEPLA